MSKSISYDRTTRDYAFYLAGELKGFAPTYQQAEEQLNALVYEQLDRDAAEAADAAADYADATSDTVIIDRPGLQYAIITVTAASVAEVAEFTMVDGGQPYYGLNVDGRGFPLVLQKHLDGRPELKEPPMPVELPKRRVAVPTPPRNPASYPTRDGVERAPDIDWSEPNEGAAPVADDVVFSRGPARRPAARVSDPLLQWSTGLSTQQRTIYAGWLCETGRSEALDDAMAAAGYETVTIKHGGGNLVTHWAVETAELFVIAEGVQSIGEMKHTAERYGVAFGWRTLPDGRQQSQLKARVLLRPLLEVDYAEPLVLSVKSTLTGDVLAALTRQYEALDAIDALRASQGQPALNPPFYTCSIALTPGEAVQRGSKGAQKEIAPPATFMPSPITRDYLVQHYIRKPWVALIEGLLDETVAWSKVTSEQIALDEGADTSEQ